MRKALLLFRRQVASTNATTKLRMRSGLARGPGMLILAGLAAGLVLAFTLAKPVASTEAEEHGWPHHGKDLANTRFQNLDQINPNNVKNLQVAWVFHTGVLDPLSELEVSPIEVNGRLFVTDGHDNVFALNAATGKKLWKFDGFNDETQL